MPQGYPQGEIASQGKSNQISRQLIRLLTNILNDLKGFLNEGPVKQTFIEVMAFTMVPQVKPEDIVSLSEKIFCCG